MLTRTVRFAVNPARAMSSAEDGAGAPGFSGSGAGGFAARTPNGFGGSPALAGLGRHFELTVSCRGEPDPKGGYLVDIKDVDRAVHARAVPLLARACAERAGDDPLWLGPALLAALRGSLRAPVTGVWLRLTPTYAVGAEEAEMEGAMATALLRQSFDLAAAHRLHVASWSAEENRRAFGKCNNPAGHGHNYRVEPVVAVKVGAEGSRFTLADLERLTEEHVVARFDHKHLNEDTREFGPGPGGVNPSVENIARVFFEALAGPVRAAGAGATLRSVTVWETDRTCATYAGEMGAA